MVRYSKDRKGLGHESTSPPPVQPDQRRAGRFKPVALTAAAVAAFGLTVGAALAASGFVDVADSHRASAEITAAHQIGVFQGYGDGTFRPDLKLTRGQSELVIHRMLTWQGTDDDGNFEISRADAAVLAMSGLCGLDPDRIPACAAVGAASEAEVQAAYDRGFDDGLDAATPTGSTPPPVTNQPPVTLPVTNPRQECEDRNAFDKLGGSGTWDGNWKTPVPLSDGIGSTRFSWGQRGAGLYPNGLICYVYTLDVEYSPRAPDSVVLNASIYGLCWVEYTNPLSGQKWEGIHGASHTFPEVRDGTYRGVQVAQHAINGRHPGVGNWPLHEIRNSSCAEHGLKEWPEPWAVPS